MVRLAMVTFDAADARSLATWWSERFGGSRVVGDAEFMTVTAPGLPLTLGFQRINFTHSEKNKIHLDLDLEPQDPSRDEVVESFLTAGATHVQRHSVAGSTWDVLADPAGNLFCVGDPH
ncbi:hypothetical protein BDB13_6092 [Rhodococcus sp. OK302]|nr:hypothetical protein BDB13_6092 [Rhodococcus sp. OK302]